ncbi:MAG TPA: ABC transporter permease [Bacillota bacterium]|nr:ABC transporter permease [Bacillota bacterium]HOL09276.1 ABC transporter permease [Bacillota bacterium]HPO96939.1 ABC transporter permease [Bacillota bacterium]
MRLSIINRNLIFSSLAIVLLIIGWHFAALKINHSLLLPAPAAVFREVGQLITTGDFWRHLGATLWRGLTGFMISFLLGLILGYLSGRSATVRSFLRPLIIFIRSTPSMSLIILSLIWFKGELVAIFVIFLVVFPIIIQNTSEGILNVSNDLKELFLVYRIKKRHQIMALYLPSIVPYLAAGIATGMGIMWKILIAAEVLSYPSWGIGVQMDLARVYLQTEKVFAWTLVVMTIGIIFDYLLDYFLRKPFLTWKGASDV